MVKTINPALQSGTRIINTATASTLEDFFYDELREMYWAEQQIVKFFPKIIKSLKSEKAKDIFNYHFKLMQTHLKKLEIIFSLIKREPGSKRCIPVNEMLEKLDFITEQPDQNSFTKNTKLIVAGQEIQHFKTAGYESLGQLASILGLLKIEKMIETLFVEESEMYGALVAVNDSEMAALLYRRVLS
ncbi:MAG: DUF892 family protein [Ferruginibacter sp.]